MSTNLQLVLDPVNGQLLFLPITGGGSGTPGGADTSVQFNDGGAFGGFGSWDGSSLAIPTIGDGDTNNLSLNLTVHQGGADEATATWSIDGNRGAPDPDTTFTLPGNVQYLGNKPNLFFFGIGNESTDTGAAILAQFYTYGNSAEGNAGFSAAVHVDDTNECEFTISLDGASGNNTPATTFTFPGTANFTVASEYIFDSDTIIIKDAPGDSVGIYLANTSTAASNNPARFIVATYGNDNTGKAGFQLGVHEDDTDAHYFLFVADPAGEDFNMYSSRSDVDFLNYKPDDDILYIGCNSVNESNTESATYSVNGNAGASGTGTVISAITVENGIITAITVA